MMRRSSWLPADVESSSFPGRDLANARFPVYSDVQAKSAVIDEASDQEDRM